MKRVRCLAVLAAALALGGCSWFGSKSNLPPPAELTSFTARAQVKPLWTADVGKGPGEKYLILAPTIVGKTIYAVGVRGAVSAYDAASGQRRWRVDLERRVTGGVGYGEGLLLIGTADGQVVALRPPDGARVWAATVASEVLAPPVARDGVVVVQTVDGRVSGLSASDGSALWTLERPEPALTLRGTGTPVIVSDIVLAGFANGKLDAVTLRDGRLLWEATVGEPHGRNEVERLIDVDSPPVVSERVAYAAAYQGNVIALDLQTGRLLWSQPLSTYTALASDANHLYATSAAGHVLAFDLHTGSTVWDQGALSGRRPTAPAVSGDRIAVGDYAGYIHWLDRADGSFVARYHLSSDAIRSQPLVDQGIWYVLNQDGELAALTLE